MTIDVIGEFIGTLLLVFLGDGVVANVSLKHSKGENAGWVAIAMGWGFAVAVAAYATGHLGPAHLNPAVSLAFAISGDITWLVFFKYVIAQMLGGFLGAILVWLMYRPHFEETEDATTILGVFATGPAIRSYGDNFISEVLGTFVLVFGIMAFGYTEMAPGFGTAVVGMLIMSIGLSLGGPTGYAINPARDLAPRIAHAILPMKHKGDSDWGYSWVPVVAPLVGGVIAALIISWIPVV